MSHFYGSIPHSARKTAATARGHKSTGLVTIAASYQGAIHVDVSHDPDTGRDKYTVTLIDWPSQNHRATIASGYLDETDTIWTRQAVQPRKARRANKAFIPA